MAHVFEVAPTGRARCRGCTQPLAKGMLRFGERVPNQFGEGEATLWFHPVCAAYKRPEPLLETLPAAPAGLPDPGELERIARGQAAHPRLARIDGAERAPGSQAKCRHCKEAIEKGSWRIRLAYLEDGRPSPGGFVHAACRRAYFECEDGLEAILMFSPGLDDAARADLEKVCREGVA